MIAVAPMEVGLAVADVDRVLAFYRDVLGMKLLTDIAVPAAVSRVAGLAPEGYRVMRLESSGGDRLKLAQTPASREGVRPADYPMQRRGGAYLTFIVDELPALERRLHDAGASIHSDGIVVLRPGVSMLLAADPEGNWLEFVHYDDLASYRPPKGKT